MSNSFIPVLLADIGGTNSRLKIQKISKNFGMEPILVHKKTFHSKDFSSINDLLAEYLKDFKGNDNYPVFAIIAIAGPIENNTLQVIANLNWPNCEGKQLEEEFNIKEVHLINDFVAVGYGIFGNILREKDEVLLTKNTVSNDNAPFIVVGPGTGQGHCYGNKFKNSIYHEVFASEGGHSTFCPFNDTEYKYKKYLQEKFNISHVSFERACSGPALVYMYNFFIDEMGMESCILNKSDKEYEKLRWEILPEAILKSANEGECKVSAAVRKLFVELLATVCSNLSIFTLPSKGVYLVGNIIKSLKEYLLETNDFFDRYYDKGRLSDFLRRFPIYIITESNIGIKGSEEYARRLIEKNE